MTEEQENQTKTYHADSEVEARSKNFSKQKEYYIWSNLKLRQRFSLVINEDNFREQINREE